MKLLMAYFFLPLYFIFYAHTIILLCLYVHINRNVSMSMSMCVQDWEPRRRRIGHGLDVHGFVAQSGSRIHSGT
jgi:hypothetical protein